MKLHLERFYKTAECTVGRLFIDDEYCCFTLEPPIREEKPRAIPEGTYTVIVDYSAHFQKRLPHLLDVPGFEGVRIHPGNTDKDTTACILTGETWAGGDLIEHSLAVFEPLLEKIKQAQNVTIEIT